MRKSSEAHVGKMVFGTFTFVAVVGLGVLVAWAAIRDLPAQEQPGAWRWFALGWVAVTVGTCLAYLPRWLNDSLVMEDAQKRARYAAFLKAAPWYGAALGLVGSSFGFMGTGAGVAIAAALSGLATFALCFVAAMLFTKKGRAMRARQLQHPWP